MTRPPPPPVPAPSSGGRRGNWILVFVLKHITCPYYLLYTPSVPLINQLLCVCVCAGIRPGDHPEPEESGGGLHYGGQPDPGGQLYCGSGADGQVREHTHGHMQYTHKHALYTHTHRNMQYTHKHALYTHTQKHAVYTQTCIIYTHLHRNNVQYTH